MEELLDVKQNVDDSFIKIVNEKHDKLLILKYVLDKTNFPSIKAEDIVEYLIHEKKYDKTAILSGMADFELFKLKVVAKMLDSSVKNNDNEEIALMTKKKSIDKELLALKIAKVLHITLPIKILTRVDELDIENNDNKVLDYDNTVNGIYNIISIDPSLLDICLYNTYFNIKDIKSMEIIFKKLQGMCQDIPSLSMFVNTNCFLIYLVNRGLINATDPEYYSLIDDIREFEKSYSYKDSDAKRRIEELLSKYALEKDKIYVNNNKLNEVIQSLSKGGR